MGWVLGRGTARGLHAAVTARPPVYLILLPGVRAPHGRDQGQRVAASQTGLAWASWEKGLEKLPTHAAFAFCYFSLSAFPFRNL